MRLCHCRFECLLGFGFAIGLLAGLKGQRFGKLNGDPAYKAVDVLNPADIAPPREVGHIERIIGTISRHAETGGNMLPRLGTAILCITGKRRPLAANINHLSLRESMVDILGEPDGPIITQSLFCSSIGVFVHCKYSKISYCCLQIGRFIGRLYKVPPGKSQPIGLIGTFIAFFVCYCGKTALNFFLIFFFI